MVAAVGYFWQATTDSQQTVTFVKDGLDSEHL